MPSKCREEGGIRTCPGGCCLSLSHLRLFVQAKQKLASNELSVLHFTTGPLDSPKKEKSVKWSKNNGEQSINPELDPKFLGNEILKISVDTIELQ